MKAPALVGTNGVRDIHQTVHSRVPSHPKVPIGANRQIRSRTEKAAAESRVGRALPERPCRHESGHRRKTEMTRINRVTPLPGSGASPDTAAAIFDQINQFAGSGFNKVSIRRGPQRAV